MAEERGVGDWGQGKRQAVSGEWREIERRCESVSIMISTWIVSLFLIGLSGVLLDLHRRSWRTAQQMESISSSDLRFSRSQYRRRTQASSTIGVLGAVLGLYPLVPQAPLAITLYLIAITLACIAMMMLAALDAWATRQNFMRRRSEQLATQIRISRELGRGQTRPHDG
jgi:hypothetical protein